MKVGGPFRQTWRWALLVAALLALLALLLIGRRAPPAPGAGTIHSQTPVAARIPPANTGSRATAVDRHATAEAPDTPVVDEFCGVKASDSARAANETLAQHVMRVTQTVISGWKNALATSDDPRRQAVGLALENAHPDVPGHEPQQDTPVNNQLVLLAIETNDPAIYALALSHCGDGPYDMAAGPCQGLSWEHWANLDPDNAAPWLAIAARADQSGNQRGVEEALAKAATASRLDSYGSTVAAIALNALPRDSAPLAKAVAGADVTAALGIGILGAHVAATLCSDMAVQEPTRRQQCTSIAHNLAANGATLLDVAVASSLARRLGFPKDRQAQLQKETQTASRALRAHNPWSYTNDGGGLTLAANFGCDTVLGYDRFLDSLQAAGGNERVALGAVGRALQEGK